MGARQRYSSLSMAMRQAKRPRDDGGDDRGALEVKVVQILKSGRARSEPLSHSQRFRSSHERYMTKPGSGADRLASISCSQ